MEKAAVQENGLLIPLIDFSKFLDGSHEQKLETANAILKGFQTAGFIYLSNIPVSASTLSHVFETSAEFFKLPLAVKESLAWTTPDANRGYSAPGREKVSQLTDITAVEALRAANPDIKESFEIGRDDEPQHPNRWPPEAASTSTPPSTADTTSQATVPPGFRHTMTTFFTQLQTLHLHLMRALALAMHLPSPSYFDHFLSDSDNTLRLLHYPAVPHALFRSQPGRVRAGEHSDYGSVTFLFQDQRGGLQVQGPGGGFVDARPIEGTCVVNAGDLLARWSNETIRSTVHRVVEPPLVTRMAKGEGGEGKGVVDGVDGEGEGEGGMHPARYSIAYFCNPNFKDFIEAIPGTYATEADKKYEGINSGEYLLQRLKATY